MFRFRPNHSGGEIVGSFEPDERRILINLLGDVNSLLSADIDPEEDPLVEMTGYRPHAEEPTDPAVLALLPLGSSDAEESLEYRRLSDFSLRQSKTQDLDRASLLLDTDTVRVTPEEAETLLRALTSVSLVLAERLDIRTDQDASLVSEISSPRTDDEFMAIVYNFVTWVRSSLSAALIDALSEDVTDETPL